VTAAEKRNLERVKLWEEAWNEDVARLVDEFYAEDCEVRNMLTGAVVRGREGLREFEQAIRAQTPDRRWRVRRAIISGDVVALEVDVCFGGKQAQCAVFLTFDEQDGSRATTATPPATGLCFRWKADRRKSPRRFRYSLRHLPSQSGICECSSRITATANQKGEDGRWELRSRNASSSWRTSRPSTTS
jgi:hypothetical protein